MPPPPPPPPPPAPAQGQFNAMMTSPGFGQMVESIAKVVVARKRTAEEQLDIMHEEEYVRTLQAAQVIARARAHTEEARRVGEEDHRSNQEFSDRRQRKIAFDIQALEQKTNLENDHLLHRLDARFENSKDREHMRSREKVRDTFDMTVQRSIQQSQWYMQQPQPHMQQPQSYMQQPQPQPHTQQPQPHMQQPQPHTQQPQPHTQQPQPHMQQPQPHMQQSQPLTADQNTYALQHEAWVQQNAKWERANAAWELQEQEGSEVREGGEENEAEGVHG
ncbi:hypothetical protein B484DRAFT_459629 [Ochromonadaceae sp. CCMP2298]|nr:hypothetical protein B484DRAFT_459629 [Ochromonadaceae sp. CCMP2298]